jgi:pyruvate/2-oxoglutarate dehydrogenase complex dihydrolipoamide acyltransferase (E2) component
MYREGFLHQLRLPDLGLSNVPVTVSLWLVPEGQRVIEGDRVVEVVAGDVAVDLSAPASGVLVEQRVKEDEHVEAGQILGLIAERP